MVNLDRFRGRNTNSDNYDLIPEILIGIKVRHDMFSIGIIESATNNQYL